MTINIKLAENWNALTDQQLREVAHGLEYYQQRVAEDPGQKLVIYIKLHFHLIKQLLRVNNWFAVRAALRQIPPSRYRQYIEFLLKGNARTHFPRSYVIDFHRYHPPGDRLKNVSIAEFSLADSLYYNWKQNKGDAYLNLLCATLYRRGPGNDLDPRMPFEKLRVEGGAESMQKISHKRKLAIAYAYEGSRNHLVAQFGNVFPPPVKAAQDPDLKKEAKKQKYVPFGKLINSKIGFDPSKLERTKKLNVYDFLGTYDNELEEIKKIKR